MRIIRVFPRRTKATPTDDLVAIARPPGFLDEADKVHISVTFTWDIERADLLAKLWGFVAPVEMGGPALDTIGGEFTPGLYLKPGYVITSRGCPNRCWFCSVWKRDGAIRELPVVPGHIIADDNLLACSESHVRAVFEMLSWQKLRAKFTGGLESARLEKWHAEALRELHPNSVYFAYDTPSDLEPLRHAGRLLKEAGVPQSRLGCYVLCGYPGDTIGAAYKRMGEAFGAGFLPFGMLYRDPDGAEPQSFDWRIFQRRFTRPAITRRILKEST